MSDRPIRLYPDIIINRIDTGWDCCVCGTYATVTGDGFTWCLKHWNEYDLGKGKTIAKMRKEVRKGIT